MIRRMCMLGKPTLPVFPCNKITCPWYIHQLDYNNCFWLLADVMDKFPGMGGFSIKDIAAMEGLDVDTVSSLIESAIKNIRIRNRKQLIGMGGHES